VTEGDICPAFFVYLYYFSNKSKRHNWFDEHRKKNRFTRHCTRKNNVLRFNGFQIFFSNIHLSKCNPKILYRKETYIINSSIFCMSTTPQNLYCVALKRSHQRQKFKSASKHHYFGSFSWSSNIFTKQFYLYFLCCTWYILVQYDVKVIKVNFDLNLRTFRKKYLFSTNIYWSVWVRVTFNIKLKEKKTNYFLSDRLKDNTHLQIFF
jgi:hypothetical protein